MEQQSDSTAYRMLAKTQVSTRSVVTNDEFCISKTRRGPDHNVIEGIALALRGCF